MNIHPTALVSPHARLGRDVYVGPHAFVEDGAEIGDCCEIAAGAVIYSGVRLGGGCRVHAGAVLGDAPQIKGWNNAESFVEIGNACTLREGVTVHRGSQDGATTRIGDRCLLMAHSHVGHDSVLGNDVVLVNGALLGGHAHVGDGAFISGHCMIHQFTRVGRLALLAGGSGSQLDVPPFCSTRALVPNRVVALNTVGLRRAGVSPAERKELKLAFKLLYSSGFAATAAAEQMLAEFTSPPVRELAEFVKSSQRGICPYFRDDDALPHRVTTPAADKPVISGRFPVPEPAAGADIGNADSRSAA